MWRLIRTIVVLLAINAACITLMIATHYSDLAWGCAYYQTTDDMRVILDLHYGAYSFDRLTSPHLGILSAVRFDNVLTYDYFSSASVHRIGIVTGGNTITTAHFDYIESPDFFARREQESSDYKYLPIMTYDRRTSMQTMTIYNLATLAPVVSSAHFNVILAKTSATDYVHLPVLWSPHNKWVAFLNPTSAGVMLTLLSPERGLSHSFLLSGSTNNISYKWSLTDRAIAVTNEQNHFIDIFATADDNWDTVKTYHLRADDSNSQLAPGYWSFNDHTFSFSKISQNRFTYFSFRLSSQTIESEGEPIDWSGLRLNDQWLCREEGRTGTLISTTNSFPSIPLADAGSHYGLCDPITQSPDGTKLVIARRPPPPTKIEWISLTTDSVRIRRLSSLPMTTQQVLAWSPDSHYMLFFVPDTQTIGDEYDGQLGILDTTTWQWKLVDNAIANSLFSEVYFSPDSSRFLVLAADRLHLLLLDMNGHLIERIQTPMTYPSFAISWSPDSATFLVAYHSSPTFSTYTRDGEALTSMGKLRSFARLDTDRVDRGWSRCEPSPKLPRLNLPQ